MNKQQVQIDVNNLKTIPCGKCGGTFFSTLVNLKHIPSIISPDGKESLVKVEGLVCVECGTSDAESIKVFKEKEKEEFDSKIIHLSKK